VADAEGGMSEIPALAEKLLADARSELTRTHQVTPVFAYEIAGQMICHNVPGALMESGDCKDLLFGLIRKIVRDNHVDRVMFLSDMYMGLQSEEQRAETKRLEKELGRGLNVVELHERGLSTKREAISVSIQTPHSASMLVQFYSRDGEAIRFEEVDRRPFGQMEGRAMFFEPFNPARRQ
jgi:hypothetical protein